MGKIEDLLVAYYPVKSKKFEISQGLNTLRLRFRYHVADERIEGSFSLMGGNISFIILSKLGKSHELYFRAFPRNEYTFIDNIQTLNKNRDVLIFSGKNVFKYLNLGDPYKNCQGGSFLDLSHLCTAIRENSSLIEKAFSDENIGETCKALVNMEGNNQEEVNRIYKESGLREF